MEDVLSRRQNEQTIVKQQFDVEKQTTTELKEQTTSLRQQLQTLEKEKVQNNKDASRTMSRRIPNKRWKSFDLVLKSMKNSKQNKRRIKLN